MEEEDDDAILFTRHFLENGVEFVKISLQERESNSLFTEYLEKYKKGKVSITQLDKVATEYKNTINKLRDLKIEGINTLMAIAIFDCR